MPFMTQCVPFESIREHHKPIVAILNFIIIISIKITYQKMGMLVVGDSISLYVIDNKFVWGIHTNIDHRESQ